MQARPGLHVPLLYCMWHAWNAEVAGGAALTSTQQALLNSYQRVAQAPPERGTSQRKLHSIVIHLRFELQPVPALMRILVWVTARHTHVFDINFSGRG
jgi:hypothetical protein